MGKKQTFSRRIVVCVAVILLTAAAFFIFKKENEKRIAAQNMEYIQDCSVQVAGRIDDVLSDGYDNIRILSTFLGRSLESPFVDVKLLQELTEDSVFDFVEFADKDGMDHNITGGISDARDRQYYLDGIKGNSGLEVIFDSRATHETLLMFYAPVIYENEPIGVMIGVYQADNRLAKLLTVNYFGEQANLYLCTPEGRVVASDQPLDTTARMHITDLAGDDASLARRISQTLLTGERLSFPYNAGKTSGCMVRLPQNGWFLVQIFPEAVNAAMVRNSNAAGVRFEITLLTIFFAVLVMLILFYRKERQDITEIAKERGKYKNAVLADAVLAFEANLTKNEISEWSGKDARGKPISLEQALGFHLPCRYDTYVERWVRRYVKEDSRELFIANTQAAYLIQVFAEGRSEITFDYDAKSFEGRDMFARRSIYLTRDEKTGDVIAYSNVKDITAMVENEMKQKALIEDALLRAENASKAKTVFLSNMSHDIRTPMNAIIGFTTLATTHIDQKEKVQDYLNKISASSRHLLSLINDVLDMSRIESGKLRLEETGCRLSEIMRGLESMLLSDLKAKNLEFVMDTADLHDELVVCDRLRLNQILLNLLGNAVKFTEPGGSIYFRILEKPAKNQDLAYYEFHVKDTGIGISEEFQKHIFEPFERERNSTVSGIQGTGLGMAITKNIVDIMGGTISVTSQKNVGTEFVVQLPLKKAVLKQAEPPAPVRKPIAGKRILLVEDNDLNREIAQELLSEEGLIVEEAADGSIAVEKLLEKGPGYYQLVLMDIQMPVMDGYRATQKIRAFDDRKLASIPIIAMTANAFDEDKKKALDTGMDAHIAKPIDVDKLLEVLYQML